MRKRNSQEVFGSDTNIDATKSLTLTLTTANAVTTVFVPDDAVGFRIYPLANDVLFGVDKTIGPRGTSSATSIPVSSMGEGSVAKPLMWEVRILPEGTERKLYLRSATASTVLELEFWG